MPNWTSNAMVCHADDLPKFVNDEGVVDFNLLIPMPDSLNQTSGSITRAAIDYYYGRLNDEDIQSYLYDGDDQEDVSGEDENGKYVVSTDGFKPYNTFHFDGKDYIIETPEQFARLGEIYVNNEAEYGAQTWYEWSNENWGTKWNACDPSVEMFGDYVYLIFNTAWSTLSPAMIATMQDAFSHDFILECVFEDEQDEVYNPVTQQMYNPEDSMLFERQTEDWDGDKYTYAAPKKVTQEYVASLF